MIITNMFFESIITAIVAAVISCTLIVTIPNERIVNWWFRFGNRIGVRLKNGMEVERWFYKPIWGCEKCFAGQLSMWIYLFNHVQVQKVAQINSFDALRGCISFNGFSVVFCLFTVLLSVNISIYFSTLINKIKND